MITAILSLVAGLLTLLMWWLQHRESPEAKRDRFLKEEQERLDQDRQIISDGKPDDINRAAADQHDRVLGEAGPDLHSGVGDKGDQRP